MTAARLIVLAAVPILLGGSGCIPAQPTRVANSEQRLICGSGMVEGKRPQASLRFEISGRFKEKKDAAATDHLPAV